MTITTFNWNTATNDLALPVSLVSGNVALTIKLRQRFSFFAGDWFLNLLEGVPYYRDILIKDPDISVVRSIFRQVILTTQDIASIKSLNIVFDSSARELLVQFVAIKTDGTLFDTSLLDQPFIVTV